MPGPGITDPAAGAVGLSISSKDEAQIVQAFESWTKFQGHCTVSPVRGTLKAATVESTGVSWAFGQFAPPPGCTVTSDGQNVDIVTARYFVESPPLDSGVFERQPGEAWVMNYYETVPFPCPDNLLHPETTPGPHNPYVPNSVVHALGVPYANPGKPWPLAEVGSNCSAPLITPEPP